MQESGSPFFFLSDARDVYQSITSVQEIIEIWDQLAFLLDQGDVDHETVFEISDGFDSYLQGDVRSGLYYCVPN